MKNTALNSETGWTTLLMVSALFASFVVPILPIGLHLGSFRIVYSIIYLAAIMSLRKRSKSLISLFIATLVTEWVSSVFDMSLLHSISKGFNIIFFLVIVFSLIHQIATSKNVTPGVILGSIAGYLLVGITFSIFISLIMTNDPSAFNTTQLIAGSNDNFVNTSVPMYFSYVTLATLGYGDIVPLKPYTRSLASFIAVCGQFYIAVIVAMLVGKFAAKHPFEENTKSTEE
jgi:voltage-gated potassium channel